jgi:hypothetical protein
LKPSDNVVSLDSSAAMLRVLSGCLRGESFPMMGARPYYDIRLGLFSHGVESVGVAPIERWRAVLSRARERGEFVGVDEKRYPRDFAAFVRDHADLEEESRQYPVPSPLTLEELGAFVGEVGERYQVRWSRASLREDEHGPDSIGP